MPNLDALEATDPTRSHMIAAMRRLGELLALIVQSRIDT